MQSNELRKTSLSINRTGASIWVGFANDLYRELHQVCREYIANAIDASANIIEINLSPPFNVLEILDNGEGFDYEEMETKLRTVGLSDQVSIETTIGRFGIWIYAGTSVCEEIEIISKVALSKTQNKIILPVGTWHKMATENPNQEISELTEFPLKEEYCREDQINHSYTIIRLKKLKRFVRNELMGLEGKCEGADLFEKKLRNILSLPFPDSVPEILKKIQQTLEKQIQTDLSFHFPLVDITFNGRKLLKLFPEEQLSVGKDYLQFPIIKNKEGSIIALGWISANNEPKAFGEKLLRGLQLRKKDIVIIDRPEWFSIVDKLGGSPRVQVRQRFVGEFHIITEDIQPTQGRNDFSENEQTNLLKKELVNLTVEYTNLIHQRDYESEYAKIKREKNQITRNTKKIMENRSETQETVKELVKLSRKMKSKNKQKKTFVEKIISPTTLNDFIEPILEDAGRMKDAYMLIYLIENLVRRFMDTVIRLQTGLPFNVTNDHLAINKKIRESIGKTKVLRDNSTWFKDIPVPSDLYYTSIDQLHTLVTSNHEFFFDYIRSHEEICKLINRTEDIRNLVMHSNMGLPNKIISELENTLGQLRVILEGSFIKLAEQMSL